MRDKITDQIIDKLNSKTLDKLSDRDLTHLINIGLQLYKQGRSDTITEAETLFDNAIK